MFEKETAESFEQFVKDKQAAEPDKLAGKLSEGSVSGNTDWKEKFREFFIRENELTGLKKWINPTIVINWIEHNVPGSNGTDWRDEGLNLSQKANRTTHEGE